MRDATLPVVLIAGGLAMLGWNYGWIPDWNTLVAIALVVAGVAIMVLDGLTKKSLVAGPVLIAKTPSVARLVIMMLQAGNILAELSCKPRCEIWSLLRSKKAERAAVRSEGVNQLTEPLFQ